jgi:hypothetical protein
VTIRSNVSAAGSSKIQDGSITESKIAAGAIVADHLAAGAIESAGIAADSVTNAKLASSLPKTYKFTYDFAVNGGAVSAITLTAADGQLPDNFVISGVHMQCVTPVTSGGAAEIALGYTGAATQFMSATAYTENAFDTANTSTNVLADYGTPSTTGAAVDVLLTVSVAALTAGKLLIWVSGFEGE